ncbi:MAG: hypothetical protein ABSE06_20255 [Anaerolineaceae bacterium]
MLVVGTILASCAHHAVPTSPTALPPTPTFTAEPTETITPTPTSTPLSFLGIGVETSLPPDEGKLTQTPVPVIPIDQLTAEDIKSKTGQGGTYPAGFMDSGRVKNELNLRVQWLSELGLNTTDKNAANYRQVVAKTFGTGDNFRYTWVIQDAKSHDLWLMIKDPGMKSGWRFADSPSWDSHLKPTDIKKFGLPQPLNPDDQFVIFDNGENVQLAELDKNGNPLRVLDTLKQEMRLLSGVEIPHSYDIVTSSVIPHDVISEFQTRAENMTPTGSEFMVNGQPVPDGYWGES